MTSNFITYNGNPLSVS